MIAGGAMFVATALVFSVSARNERRFRAPDRPIPSQRWASHTLEDDPDYYEKRAAYHENKAPLLTRILPDKGHHH